MSVWADVCSRAGHLTGMEMGRGEDALSLLATDRAAGLPPTSPNFFLLTLPLTSPISHCLPDVEFRYVFSAPSNPRSRASKEGMQEELETRKDGWVGSGGVYSDGVGVAGVHLRNGG